VLSLFDNISFSPVYTSLEVIFFFTSFLAYYQTDRRKFLVLNSLAIFAIGISFYLKGGMVGALVELGMLIIHISAFFISSEIEKRLKLLIPPLAFILVYYFNDEVSAHFIALAISFFVLGVYQENMKLNKLFFAIGLIFLSMYSFSLGLTFIGITNLFGILVLSYRVRSMYRNTEQ